MNSNAVTWRVYEGHCKDCGVPFTFSESAFQFDQLRGLSKPSRCPKCRAALASLINSSGTRFWEPPARQNTKTKDRLKLGLMKVASNPAPAALVEFPGSPEPDMEAKFQLLDPVVERLIANLEDPNGTRVSILVGPTGTGKSVWATYRLLRSRLGREGRICVTQPRKITLRGEKDSDDDSTTPGFIAKQLLRAPGLGAGQEVGLRYRGEASMQDRYTKLLFVTDGILIRWIVSGEIGKFGIIVIDEAHEQSSNMELIFALLKYKMPLYPRLRLVIASATVDVEKFCNYFGDGAPGRVFVAQPTEAVGTRFIIHDRWPDAEDSYTQALSWFTLPESAEDVPAAVAGIVWGIRTIEGFTRVRNPNGDIVVFVPTIRLVQKTIEAIESLRISNLEVLPCYADMPPGEYSAFRHSEKRAEKAQQSKEPTAPQRVIVATNYAETSVTLSNLVYVIDSGYVMEPKWDPKTCSRDYPTTRHTQAGCTQRKGRVGRVQEGEVFRLYAQKDFSNENIFRKEPSPEISRASLDRFLLTAKAAGIDDLSTFKWLGFDSDSASQNMEKQRSLNLLQRCAAIDNDGDITARGLELERIETEFVDFGLFVSESDSFACTLEVATFLAFTGQVRSVFLPNKSGLIGYARWRTGCLDDLEFYLRVFYNWQHQKTCLKKHELESWCLAEGINCLALVDIEKVRANIFEALTHRTHTNLTKRTLDVDRLFRVRMVLARSLPEWVYVRNTADLSGRFYKPLMPERCPCQSMLGIDSSSACVADATVEAIIGLERIKVGGVLLAKHIIRVKNSWLDSLTSASQVGAALTLKASLAENNHGNPKEASKQILSRPGNLKITAKYQKDQLYKFKAIRPLATGDDTTNNTWLIESQDGAAMLAHFDCTVTFSPGAIFRACVVNTNRRELTIELSQQKLIDSYPVGTVVEGAIVVSQLANNSDGQTYALIAELEPGIAGRIHKREFGRSPNAINCVGLGQGLAVHISSKKDKFLELALVKQTPQVGSQYDGYVINFLKGQYGHDRSGAFVEFLPYVEGFLHFSDIGSIALSQLGIGDAISVKLVSADYSEEKQKYLYRLSTL